MIGRGEQVRTGVEQRAVKVETDNAEGEIGHIRPIARGDMELAT
jgi:hypothetical protein